VIYSILEIIFFLLLPLVLILVVTITYTKRRGMYAKIGFGGREVGLLVLGPFAAMLFDLPIFIYKNYFLAINIGGALIPLSILLFSPHSEKTPGYGYAIATIGVLVGGDIFHLPEIFRKPFSGSMGGAGLYDMVYIAGLLSFCIIIFFMSKEIKYTPHYTKKLQKRDLYALDKKQSFLLLIKKVEEKAVELAKWHGIDAPPSIILKSLIGENAWKDYLIMKRKSRNPSMADVEKAWITASIIISAIEEKKKKWYATTVERCASFLFDFLIIGGISILFSILFYMKFFPSFLLFFFSTQFVYFTLFEYLSGSTIGKMVIGISVKEENMEKAEFMTSFTRNIIRFLDMALGFYFISLILIKFSPKKQRLGDLIAGSVVVKNM